MVECSFPELKGFVSSSSVHFMSFSVNLEFKFYFDSVSVQFSLIFVDFEGSFRSGLIQFSLGSVGFRFESVEIQFRFCTVLSNSL